MKVVSEQTNISKLFHTFGYFRQPDGMIPLMLPVGLRNGNSEMVWLETCDKCWNMKSVTVGTDQSGVCLNRPLVLMCYCALLQVISGQISDGIFCPFRGLLPRGGGNNIYPHAKFLPTSLSYPENRQTDRQAYSEGVTDLTIEWVDATNCEESFRHNLLFVCTNA